MDIEDIIQSLQLKKHPLEGGYFFEAYRSTEKIPFAIPCEENQGLRSLATAIYFFLTPETFSELHRLPADEIFHFYLGDPVEMLLLPPHGPGLKVTLGPDLLNGQFVQAVVPKFVWQGSRLRKGGRFALMGTTMSPGFEFKDYERADTAALVKTFPEFEAEIAMLSGNSGIRF